MLWSKFQRKFVFAAIQSLTNSENPSSKPLQEAYSDYQVAALDCKAILKAVCDSENCSKIRLWILHWVESTKENWNRNFDVALGSIFRMTNYFQISKQKLFIYFLFNKAA
jgi:hypothetical protein